MSTPPTPPSSLFVSEQLARAEAHCRTLGVRFTPIRSQVFVLLLELRRAVKAYELLEAMKSFHDNAKPATVYRALEFLLDAGLVHRIDSLNAYVACSLAKHDHSLLLVCSHCNAVEEINDPVLCHQLADRAQSVGYQIEGLCVEIKAVCRNCQPEAIHCCAGH